MVTFGSVDSSRSDEAFDPGSSRRSLRSARDKRIGDNVGGGVNGASGDGDRHSGVDALEVEWEVAAGGADSASNSEVPS